jgi:enoyl-CoA hydratase/carnithine racemase
MTDYTTIRFERRAGIGTLTLARPAKRNAQNPKMWQELQDLGRRLSADETLRCLVVTGEGPSFSAGIDLVEGMAGLLGEWAERAPDEQSIALGLQAAGTFNWIPRLSCPSGVGVRGHA